MWSWTLMWTKSPSTATGRRCFFTVPMVSALCIFTGVLPPKMAPQLAGMYRNGDMLFSFRDSFWTCRVSKRTYLYGNKALCCNCFTCFPIYKTWCIPYLIWNEKLQDCYCWSRNIREWNECHTDIASFMAPLQWYSCGNSFFWFSFQVSHSFLFIRCQDICSFCFSFNTSLLTLKWKLCYYDLHDNLISECVVIKTKNTKMIIVSKPCTIMTYE